MLEQMGPLTAVELGALLNLDQVELLHLTNRVDSRVLPISQAGTTKYALVQALFDAEGPVPLYEIDAVGQPKRLAKVWGLAGGDYFIEADVNLRWLQGESHTFLYAGLPYFLDDLRPQGFLGRLTSRRYARQYHYPADPRMWSEHQIGLYLTVEGYDLPGNLILGEHALQSFRKHQMQCITNRALEFPERVKAVLLEDHPGSSAGGEQPKFIGYTQENGHVLVKFSPVGMAVDARRWQDLLICEYHAIESLQQAGIITVHCELFEFHRRIYLETRRFDRVGEKGRLSMISLAAIDAEFIGVGQQWSLVAQRLYQMGLLSSTDLHTVVFVDLYGQWIGNSDRHLGNLSLSVTDNGFSLLPIYDMLPMMYAPERGEIIHRQLIVPVKPAQYESLWQKSGDVARNFWCVIKGNTRVSAKFRRIAGANMNLIEKALLTACIIVVLSSCFVNGDGVVHW